MSTSSGKNRQERSSTIPSASPEQEDRKQRQSRQHAISHRPHASHAFVMHRNSARDGAHQLGADIANFLTTRSSVPSATPSRSASRHPSGEEQLPEARFGNTSDTRQDESGSTVGKLTATWDDVGELKRLREDSQLRLRGELEGLSTMALSGSRQVDNTLQKIQADMKGATAELNVLRALAQSTDDMLLRFNEETVPPLVQEHEKQVLILRNTYQEVEQTRIGDLEKRLDTARLRVDALKERMQIVRAEVGEWEIRDKEDLRRSQRRHWILWTAVGITFALLAIVLTPRPERNAIAKLALETNWTGFVTSGEKDEVQKEAKNERLLPPPRTRENDDHRFKMFDEL